MKHLLKLFPVLSASLIVLMASVSSTAMAYPIAGLTPDQRPAGAPVIKEFKKTNEWYVHALHGVSKPYPYSLHFLEDQGGWYTPFNHPGMTHPYDIRGWHKQ